MVASIERWLPVANSDGRYEISDRGRVRSLYGKGRILKPNVTPYGYLQVKLLVNGIYKQYKIHRLVAEAFIENQNGYSVIHHKDGDTSNNSVENLEWCTVQYNNAHRYIH